MEERKNYKTTINSVSPKKNVLDKNTVHHKNDKKRFSLILDSSSKTRAKRFESLININEDNIILNTNENKHNITFTLNPKIRKKLLKEYKHEKKKEKKYRKLKIIQNLIDSSQSSEESSEEDGNIGLNFYISSESFFILIFDALILLFSLFSVIYIPLNLAERKFLCKEEKTIWIIFQYFTEILFFIDIVISFFRSYYNYEYKKVTLTSQIFKYYLTKGFILDCIAAFPSYSLNRKLYKNRCNYINKFLLNTNEIAASIILVFKIFKVLKALSHKRNKIIELIYEKISDFLLFEQIVDIIIYIIKIFSVLHTLICIHIFIGEQNIPNWMVHINIQNETLLIKYISSLYFMIETMTTVGYGDIVCISPLERFFQLIILSIGIVSYSFIITKFGNYIMKKSKEEIELDEKKIQLEQIRIHYPLMPFKLYIKIQEFLVKKACKKENKKNEINKIIEDLPEQLRNELILIINKDIINNFTIFKDCKNTDFIIKTLSCFIQVICKKETILIKEGQKVQNIIFVKDGRLILEAKIDLLKPYESYKKYFVKNFKYIDKNRYKKESILSNDNTNNQGDINIEKLKTKLNNLLENVKAGTRADSTFNINTMKGILLFQNDKNLEENENSNINNKTQESGKYQYLKILDIRKNENFGDIFMLLDKPSPLTLKVKSKTAEIFILREKDALMISNIHHNIVKRIHDKSYKNLLSIKKKTFHILKKYFDLNNYNNIELQDKSWFNEKSKSIILQDITNFINNTINKSDKNNTGGTTIDFQIKNLLNDNEFKSLFTRATNAQFDKNNYDNKSMNLFSNNWIPKSKRKSIINVSRKSIFSNHASNYIPKIIIKDTDSFKKKNFSGVNNNSNQKEQRDSTQTNNTISKLLNIRGSPKQFRPSKFSVLKKKTTNEELSDKDLLELTREEEMFTLNNLKNDIDFKIRKKIKSSVKRNKILKLSKVQNILINSYQEEINNSLINDEINVRIKNNFKKISDLSNILHNNILEFLETDYESGDEKEELHPSNIKNKLIIDRNINFKIEASYYNFNNLTNGKIIKNEKYKNDIKYLIEKYINIKKKDSLNLINEFIKQYNHKKYKEEKKLIKKNLTQNKNIGIPHIDNISLVINNIINDNAKNNKNKYVQKIPKHANTKKNSIRTPKFVSNQIKKTKTNNKLVYKNFKNLDYDDKSLQKKLNNNKKIKSNSINFNKDKNKNNDKVDEDNEAKDSNIFENLLYKVISRLKIK